MKILVITQMYSQPDDAGDNKPTKTVNYFVKEWTAMGHEVVVMHCPSKFPYFLYMLPNSVKERFAGKLSTMVPPVESRKKLKREEAGATVFRLPMLKFKPGQAYSSFTMKRQASKIEKILDGLGFKPDLVAGHFSNPSLELTANVAEHYNAKSSIVFHRDCTKQKIERYRIKENIKRIGAVGARSVGEAERIRDLLGLDKLPFVCCSGVPNDAIESHAVKCEKQDYCNGARYIYAGSFIKRKHVDTVINAFAAVSGENDTLTIVGGGPEEEKLKNLVSQTGKTGKITFTGRISRKEVLDKMAEAQIFTLVSDGETYGMVYIEAMLQGCITIASKGGGFDGIIKDGENGFICEPGNQQELENLYKKIAGMSTGELNRIGQAAIDTAVHFSEREVAENYLNDILKEQR